MSGIAELLDVVEHLARTHNTWNGTLTQAEALEKVAAARVKLLTPDVEQVVSDVETTVGDVEKTITDAKG